MDEIFKQFQNWFLSKKDTWKRNGYYWVDFEGGNYDYDIIFQRAGIEFHSINKLDIYEKDFIKHITWNGGL